MLEYQIKYSKIKNIYIQIKNGQVIIKAPKRVSKKEIEKLIEQKAEWIKKGLEKEKQKQCAMCPRELALYVFRVL